MPVNNTHSRNKIELPTVQEKSERVAAYHAALNLVARIDEDLTRGVRHYRNRNGHLLTTLDEVVRAILSGSLPEEA